MVGDMISVIDMPPPEESIWWRGKRGFQVGFFPCECVQVIGDKVPQTIQPQTLTLPPARTQPPIAASLQHHTLHSGTQAPTKPVLRKHGKLIAFFRSFILSRPSRRKLKQSGILRERVFGCDLGEHLLNSGHEIPMVLRCCSEFLESHGVVDGIYRLSGITSNIQKLRNAFDEDRIPDLYGDDSIVQDIHCVSSVLKMYFRELPNPLLTYQLYEKFVAAVIQDEDIRLLYLRDVVQQLPPPHYRTLEYLVQHLARVASHSAETGMTAKNIAIVWAPNLLRSKDLDMGGVAALQDVGTQAVVTEYLVRYVDLIFNDKIPTFSHSTNGVEGTPKKSRPKSLAISTPTKLISIEEARSRALSTAIKPDQKYIEVGGGPQNLPPKYHTVIELPSRKGGSLKQKKSPSGWKSIFSKGRSVHKHPRKASTPSDIHLNISDSVVNEADIAPSSSKRLRPVKSVESLISTSASLHSNRNSQALESPEKREFLMWEKYEKSPQDERESRSSSMSSPIPSPRTHNRSVSHDSYFNTLESRLNNVPSQVPVKEEGESDIDFSPDNSRIYLDISELDLNFSTSEKDLKGFEVDTLKSTSVEDPDNMSSSTLDMENLSMCSESGRSKENLSPRPEKKSLKEKFKHRFTSPPTHRRTDPSISDSSEDSCNNSLKRASASLKDKIVHALSPETSRRRTETSPRPTSPSSSPKFKHVRTAEVDTKEGQTLKLDGHSLKPEISSFLSGARLLPEHDKSRETITAEIHVEAEESQECDDTPSRNSMDYALIDPELLDKITHLRTSPSVSASEVSSTSLAEATVSDNESFTLGSSSSGVGIVGYGRESLADAVNTLVPSYTSVTPIELSVAIIGEKPETQQNLPIAPVTPVTPVQEDLTPQQELPKPRPSSLLGLPTADLLNLGSALTSPETPQGDSTFLEIQYHPLSDTTEPSTPSESQFVQDLVGVGQPMPYPPAIDEPRQSSPLSIDLSSSDDQTEEGPMYENVDTSSSGLPLKVVDSPFDETLPQSSLPSVQSSQTSFQTCETGGQVLLVASELPCSDVDYENYNYNSVYENVKYGAEYENVEYRPEYQNVEYETENGSKNDEKYINSASSDVSYENVDITEDRENMVVDSAYENVESPAKESLPVYENLEESSDEHDQIVPDTDDAYEEYSFRDHPNYENVEFSSQVSTLPEKTVSDDKTEVEIEGEMVYQQVKFLRKSIQEVNDMLKVQEEKPRALEESDVGILSVKELGTTAHVMGLPENSSELPVQVPQMGNMNVSQTYEPLPCSQDSILDPEVTALDTEIYTQPSEDSECLDSPITPSSVSMATEVLVLPSFASPTESTTDDVTSPVSSDDASSPKPIQETLDHCSSSCTLPPILPSLSPPTPENIPVPPAATSTPNRALPLPSIISPAPWPRTTPRHTPIVAPVPRPRQLPKLNLSSPLISPVSTPSSVSISPDSPATPGTPSNGSAQATPTEENASFSPVFKPSQLPFNIQCETAESGHSFDLKVHHNLGDVKSQIRSTEGEASESALPTEPESLDSEKLTECKPISSQFPAFQRFKSSPDFRSSSKDTKLGIVTQENLTKEAEDTTTSELASILSNVDLMDPQKRERIEQYKKERRSFLREKYKSESFRGEKDEMIMRLKQKATSPSRPEEECGENDDEITQSSEIKCASPRRRESISPTKQLHESLPGKTSPVKQLGDTVASEKYSIASQIVTEKKGEQGDELVFKRASPARRSLSDMGRVGELKSPTRTRYSSESPTPTFQRSSSSSCSNSSNRSNDINPRSSLRQSPDKEIILSRSSSGDSKSSPLRKNSAPISPIKSPSGTPTFHRSASTRGSGRCRTSKDDIDEDINVKERVAIWAKSQEKPPNLDKLEKDTKSEKANIKQDQKSGMESITKNSTPPVSPVRKTSIPKAAPSSPSISKTVPSPPAALKSSSSGIPKATPPPPANAPKKIGRLGEGSSDTSALAAAGNAATRGNTGQQRRIRDMAAIFERDSPSSAKPTVIRQSSREEKKERY
ncbi:hypothetical protein OTU49_015137 [Cherax quadricarinatus]|uniref:Uncharacterized protein n=1 Tax=Cherax quadricarinatus TaxID=27406 RepID=A0AAW0YAT9_CHEQU